MKRKNKKTRQQQGGSKPLQARQSLIPDRTYKSRMFEMIFSDKKELLALYNAINGTSYTDPDELVVNTLENAIYMAMHNDISFLIDKRLNLYEHQSTYSPNLPLRFLFYVADVYSDFTKEKNLYGSKTVQLPTPHFIIFYNGTEEQPDRRELRLSDTFQMKEEEPRLELKATMLNINKGHNKKLLDACKALKDYAEYTALVREYAQAMPLSEAVERAVDDCISRGVLAEFLKKNRAEAIKVSIYEYDEERHMRQTKEEGFEEGYESGYESGRESGLAEGEKIGRKMLKQVILLRHTGKSYEEIAAQCGATLEEVKDMLEGIE